MPDTVPELLSALSVEVTPDGEILLARLREQLGAAYWPERVFAAAVELFGPQLHNEKGRTRIALSRRVTWAVRVWQEKYGPLTPGQWDYLDGVLEHALRGSCERARVSGGNAWAFVQAEIGRMVNHEKVDAGFKRRAAEAVDITAELKELVVVV